MAMGELDNERMRVCGALSVCMTHDTARGVACVMWSRFLRSFLTRAYRRDHLRRRGMTARCDAGTRSCMES